MLAICRDLSCFSGASGGSRSYAQPKRVEGVEEEFTMGDRSSQTQFREPLGLQFQAITACQVYVIFKILTEYAQHLNHWCISFDITTDAFFDSLLTSMRKFSWQRVVD